MNIFIVTYDTLNGGCGVLGEWYPSTLDAAKAICQHIHEGDPESIQTARCYTDELEGVYRIEELNGPNVRVTLEERVMNVEGGRDECLHTDSF